MKNVWVILATVSLLAAGCGPRPDRKLGLPLPPGTPLPIASLEAQASDGPVLLAGTMTRKCPVAGCWFVLRDKTGSIKVDTKGAGFVVVDVPLGRPLTVAGHILTQGTERWLEATSVSY